MGDILDDGDLKDFVAGSADEDMELGVLTSFNYTGLQEHHIKHATGCAPVELNETPEELHDPHGETSKWVITQSMDKPTLDISVYCRRAFHRKKTPREGRP